MYNYYMNEQQELAYDYIKQGKNVFVTGSAGTGKTFFIKTILHRLKQEYPDKVVGVTSMTGSSAILIDGTTLHSYLGIGIEKETLSMIKRICKYKKRDQWLDTDILIIDEISMISKDLFESMDYIGKKFRNNPRLFGGIQVILCGDFCQLGCIDSNMFCFESELWERFIHKSVIFTQIYRQEDDIFTSILNRIRLGTVDKDVITILNKCVRKYEPTSDQEITPTRLYPYRKNVDMINNMELDRLTREKGEPSYEFPLRTKAISKIKNKLKEYDGKVLCRNAQVILTVNLDIEAGLVNGSRGIITKFINGIPIVTFVNGITCPIDYYTYTYIQDKDIHEKITYSQIPLILGYAITIHKSQGMTLDCVETNLSDVFDYGQAYVTLSRLRSLKNLWIENIDYSKIICNPKVIQFYSQLSSKVSI